MEKKEQNKTTDIAKMQKPKLQTASNFKWLKSKLLS